MSEVSLTDVAAKLAGAERVVVVTGAGISADSGIPTFRDAMTGMWKRFEPNQLATPEAFARHPAIVSRWYDERRIACRRCSPNAGHVALVDLEQRVRGRGAEFTLLTQNVDRLHQRAGAQEVWEVHGSLFNWRCTLCGGERLEMDTDLFVHHPVRCDACGGLRRPSVVWFGEVLPEAAMLKADEALEACDVFLSIGTSGMVHPVAGYVEIAKCNGNKPLTVEVNQETTAITHFFDEHLRGTASDVLPKLMEALDAIIGQPTPRP